MSLLSEVSKTVVNAQLAFTGATGSSSTPPPPSLAQPYVQTGTPVIIPNLPPNGYGIGAFDENTTIFAYPCALADGSAVFYVFTNNETSASAAPQFTLAATVPIAGATTASYVYSALSRSGLVYVVGSPNNNAPAGAGAFFVFTRPTRESQAWTQVATVYGAANDLVGAGVSMSADGSVIAVGASGKNNQVGQTDVYNFNYATGALTLTASLVGSGAVGRSRQGNQAVSLAGNGQTLAVGGSADAGGVGAVWVFNKNGTTTWTQTGAKLVPFISSPNPPAIGFSVSLSFDGKTLAIAVGGASNVVLYTLGGNGIWVQGQNISPLGAPQLGAPYFVTISDDANILMFDYYGLGGVFVYNRQPDGRWVQNGTLRTPYSLNDQLFPYLSAMSPSGSMFASVPTFAPLPPGSPLVFAIFH